MSLLPRICLDCLFYAISSTHMPFLGHYSCVSNSRLSARLQSPIGFDLKNSHQIIFPTKLVPLKLSDFLVVLTQSPRNLVSTPLLFHHNPFLVTQSVASVINYFLTAPCYLSVPAVLIPSASIC